MKNPDVKQAHALENYKLKIIFSNDEEKNLM